MDEKDNGTFVNADIRERTDLTGDEKILLSQILHLDKANMALYAQTRTIAKMLGCSPRQVQRYLSHLYDKKLIMYRRTSLHATKRVILGYNLRTIKYYEGGAFPNDFHLDYKK